MNRIREGDLYKIFTVCGKTFELHYGYYDEIEKYENEVLLKRV